MGCNDSKSQRKDMYGSDIKNTSRTKINQSKLQVQDPCNDNSYSEIKMKRNQQCSPVYKELESMYKKSNGSLTKFLQMIQGLISKNYMKISEQTLNNINHQEIDAEQSKVIISEEILSLNIQILKVIGYSQDFNYSKQIFGELNNFQRKVVGYLKAKYPRGQRTFVSGELMNIFEQFDKINDLKYDILNNYNMNFRELDEKLIIKQIKQLINKVMDECDKFYPSFEVMMQKAFYIENSKREKINLNYKIGRKIPENVAKYEQLDTGVLEVSSPHIFRVLIKWMEDLEATIQNTSQINKKKSFKCYFDEKQTDPNDTNQAQNKFKKDQSLYYTNQYEYNDIFVKLISKIENLKPKLEDKKKYYIKQLNEFNQSLLKILITAVPHQGQVPIKQIETIKYSSFNAKFVQYILTEKLVYVIKQLIEVGKTFNSEYMTNLDVIRFKVTDLMRCQVSGSQKQIIKIYNNFKSLEKNNLIKILKIKNRLKDPLNDVMIIFMIKDCSIICEAQLILYDAGDTINKKNKNIEKVNHYFYELERSPYGIMAEIAMRLTYNDSKIQYENKIKFHENDVDIQKCKQTHPTSVIQVEKQNTPFICSQCSEFYRKSQNLFHFYQCNQCKVVTCSKCISKKHPKLRNSFVMRQIKRYLQSKLQQIYEQKKVKMQQMGIRQRTKPQTILNLFQLKRLYFRDTFGCNNNNVGKIQASKLMQVLKKSYKFYQSHYFRYFLIVNFLKGSARFNLYSYCPQNMQIKNTINFTQKYIPSSNISYSGYDLLLMLQTNIRTDFSTEINQKHLMLFGTNKQLEQKIKQIKLLEKQDEIKKDTSHKIISIKFDYTSMQMFLDYEDYQGNRFKSQSLSQKAKKNLNNYEFAEVEKKKFTHASLSVIGDKLYPLQYTQATIEFYDLGIQSIHLDYFKNLQWRRKIKELNITHNKIKDLAIILDKLDCLQSLYFNNNYVKQLKFNKSLPNLKILNGANNLIASIHGLSHIDNIRKLLLGNNKIEQFPKCKDLKFLNILNLKKNKLSNLSNILQIDFPQLEQLIISAQEKGSNKNQESNQDNYTGFFESFLKINEKFKLTVVKYPKLINFQNQDNPITSFAGNNISFQSKSLKKISINYCSIQKLIFSKRQFIQNLKYLHLRGNKIKDFTFLNENPLQNQNTLNNQSARNQQQIGRNMIINDSLIELDLSENQIQQLPQMKFLLLKRFQLQKNQLQSLQPLQNSKIPELQYLNLSENYFSEMFPLPFSKLITLKLQRIIYLHGVNIIFNASSQLTSLQNISFHQSQVIDFTSDDQKDRIFNLPNLQILNLNKCLFKIFPTLKLPKLKVLTLSDAKAESYENLQRSQLPFLMQLQLNRVEQTNAIIYNAAQTNLPFIRKQKSISKSNNFLKCEFYFSKLQKLIITNCSIGSLKGLQNHKYSKLQYIQIQDIKTQDKKAPKINAPNLTELYISNFKLPNADDFIGNIFPKLTKLQMQNNEIQIFDESTLSSLTQIQTLCLGKNKIKKLTCSKNLDKLAYVDLSSNCLTNYPRLKAKNLSNITIDKNQFKDLSEISYCDLPTLESIKLQTCQLSKAGLPILNLPGLQILDIKQSQLSDISNLAQSQLLSITSIDLSRNKIVDISAFEKLFLPALTTLDLALNKIVDITALEKSNLPALSTLNFSGNKIVDIRALQKSKMTALTQLYLGGNQIVDISPLKKSNMTTLTLLYLNRNHISHVSTFQNSNLLALKYLDLYQNQIVDISAFQNSNLLALILLNLKANKITGFRALNLPHLDYLDLFDNKISSVPNLDKMKGLQILNVQKNPIKNIDGLLSTTVPSFKKQFIYDISQRIRYQLLSGIRLLGAREEDKIKVLEDPHCSRQCLLLSILTQCKHKYVMQK